MLMFGSSAHDFKSNLMALWWPVLTKYWQQDFTALFSTSTIIMGLKLTIENVLK